MREIKFRAWVKDSDDEPAMAYPGDDSLYMLASNGDGFSVVADLETWLKPEQFEVMQFTGLRDKNGKNIYEGDIMKMHEGVSVVVYQAPSFVMKEPISRGRLSSRWSDFILAPSENQFQEVIGNIYENPELLKP